MNITVVINPAARGGAHTHAATRAADRLRELGHTTTLVSGGSAEESSALIRSAVELGTDALAVVGGDGIINLALQELAGTTTPLALVPAGTGNDLATQLGIPTLAPETAADVIAAGHTVRLDLGRVLRADGSSTLYATVLASGFDSYVNDRANAMRWPKGQVRYDIAILVEFLFLKSTPYWIEIDGHRIDGPFMMASVGNTRTYGGGIPICADADPTDGVLDVTIVRPAGRIHLLRLLPKVYKGTHLNHPAHPEVEHYRGSEIRLHSDALTAYADGDPIGRLPLTVQSVPGAVNVFAPAP